MDSSVIEKFSHVKAVYFDLDDTLCGYWDAAKSGLRSTFDKHPIEGISTEEMYGAWSKAFRDFSPALKDQTKLFHEYLTSGTVTRTHQMQLTLLSLGIDDMELAHNLSFTYMLERDKNLKLFPESLPVLQSLHGKFPLGLITNGPADIQNQEVDTLGIRHFFDNIFIEGEMRIGKPNIEVFNRAAAAVGLEPHQILMVGNSFGHDIKPAIKYGWVSAWIRRDSDVPPSSEDLLPEPIPTSGPLPDIIIEDLSELLPLLKV